MNITKKESGLNKQNKTPVQINGKDYTDVLIEQVWDVDGKPYHTLGSWNHEVKDGKVVIIKHGMRGTDLVFVELNKLMAEMYEQVMS